jgi:uncharacterized membrane protein YgcG
MNVMRLAAAAIVLAVFGAVSPALAATPIQDGAGLFSPSTVSQLDEQIADFTSQTGKQIVVVTVPSLNGQTIATAARDAFTSQSVNGILLYIAKAERQDYFATGSYTSQFFPQQTLDSIRTTMESQFRDGDYDGGVTSAVDGMLNVFRAHLNSAPVAGNARAYPVAQSYPVRTHQGVHISMFAFILLAIVGFLVLRSIFRAACGPRYYGGSGMPGPGNGPGPGYGGPYPGYGGGYYGGGGGFWSGLLGGLGGAWLGNEMFGNRGTTIIDNNSGGMIPTDQGGSWGGGDQGGWGNDAGQIGGGSGGDFSGGGFGGGGDFGGGGFGGGGDSGGGW